LLFSLGVHEVIRSTNILAILCMVNGQCCNQLFNLEHILCCYVFLLLMYFLSPGAYTNLSIHFEYFFLVTCTVIITSCLVIFFFLLCGRLTGQTWILLFYCKGAPKDKELIELEIDRADINFYNLLFLKSKFGFAGRDFLYYKKRCGGDKTNLTSVDYDIATIEMIQNNIKEKKVRMLLSRDQPTQWHVSITLMKRSMVLEPCR
jgi:hypothetical protein